MRTECCECDRIATQFHGRYAYCSRCIGKAMREDPNGRQCIKCGETQPPQVMWLRNAPCKKCQQKGKP